MEGSGKEQPGVFYSFEALFGQLSSKLDDTMRAITTQLAELNGKLDTKASREHVDQVEKRLALAHEQLERRVKDAEDDIVEIKVADAGPRAVGKVQLTVFAIVTGGVFTMISALVYVVASGGR